MRRLIIILPLSAMAADIQISWQSTEPVTLSAIYKGTEIAKIETDQQSYVMRVDGKKCLMYRVCNRGGCAEIKPQRITKTKMVECK